MDGISLLLNLAVVIWLLLGATVFACWYVPIVGRHLYFEQVFKYFLVATAVILALAGLLRFVRMEE